MSKLDRETAGLYKRFRPFTTASIALHYAKTVKRFRELEDDGVVRLRAEPEEENYFDVFGKPDTREEYDETVRILELYGCWYTVSEYFDGKDWQIAGSCGMHTGYKDVLDPFENYYVVDEMREAIDAYENEHTEANDAACRDIATV